MKPTDISGYEIGGIMLSNEELKARIKELGAQITQDYAGEKPLIIGTLTVSYTHLDVYKRQLSGCGCVEIISRIADTVELFEPDFRMFPFIICSFLKDIGDLLISFVTGCLRVKRIFHSRFGFSGEGVAKIFVCFRSG